MKMSLRLCRAVQFAALRAVLSAVVLLGAVAVSRRSLKPPPLGWTALLGLFQTAGFAGLGLWALETGGAGKTSVLAYTMPFWLLMMAWVFLGEKVRGLQWLAVGLAFVGLISSSVPGHFGGGEQPPFAIAAGFAWAAGAVVAKIIHKRHRVDVLSLTAWQMLLGAVPLVVVAFATGCDLRTGRPPSPGYWPTTCFCPTGSRGYSGSSSSRSCRPGPRVSPVWPTRFWESSSRGCFWENSRCSSKPSE